MAVRLPASPVNPFPPSRPLDRRALRAFTAAAVLLAASSCSVLPPSLRGKAETAPVPQAQFGPAPAPAGNAAAMQAGAGREANAEAKVYKGTGNFLNAKPAPGATPPGPEEASLNFEALDVREVAKVILGDYLKQSYTVHPGVQGTVTFRTIKPIPLKDLLPTLEMLLRQNNAAVVREEGIYKILPINQVKGSVTPQLGGSTLPIQQGFSVLVVPLKYVGAREMGRLLEPFAPPESVRVDEVRNLVIMAGNERELRHLVDTVELFDVDWLAGYSMGLFPIRSADVKALVADLDKVFGNAAQSPLAGIVRVIPIERLNALLVVTTQPRYLDMAKTWIDRIDQAGSTSGGTRFYVYQVRNGKAESLAQLIGDLFSSRRTTTTAPTLAPGSRPAQLTSPTFGQISPQTTTTTVTPAPGAATFSLPGGTGTTTNEVRVIADKDTNSLLILASPSDYETIENALRQLDVVPRQVLVEVMLAEVTLTDNLSLGLEYFIHPRNNTSGQLNLGALPPSPTGIVPFPAAGALQLINFSGNEVRAVLNALGQDSKARVLASPQIMVLDNQKAQIKVGNRISVQTQTQTGVSTGTGVLNSFQYLETGVLLAVTPRINSGGMVTLDVNQEVSVADPTSVTGANPNPTVNSRSAQTSVVVASGESIVLGGLIREDNNRSTSGIPLLSKIPVIGALFGTQGYQRNRTELVLIITPRIISDSTQAREATLELRKKLPALEGLLPKPEDLPIPANPPVPRGK
jgi:general secretion pathway protein D